VSFLTLGARFLECKLDTPAESSNSLVMLGKQVFEIRRPDGCGNSGVLLL